MNNKQTVWKEALLWTAIGLTILLIWGQSCLNAEISGAESQGFSKWIMQLLGITEPLPEHFHGIIRKLAHFTEYAILGGEAALVLLVKQKGRLKFAPIAILCCMAIALCDETIQLFAPGRAGLVTDIWIDTGGTCFGYTLFALLGMLRNKHSHGKRKKSKQ